MKTLMVVVALLVGGCESEAPNAQEVDAGTVVAVDCGAAADAMVAPALPARASYAVTFERTSDGELGACGFDLDSYIGRLDVDGDAAAWSADGPPGMAAQVARSAGRFELGAAETAPAIGDVRYPLGPCAAVLASDGSWSCEMHRQWVEADDSIRCFNRYRVTGTLLP